MSSRFINLGQPVIRAAALNRGLVSWYLALPQGPYFGGPRFLDLCGANHGTLTGGAAWGGSAGRLGGYGSIGVGAGGGYVDFGDVEAVDGLSQATFSFWARPSTLTISRAFLAKYTTNGWTIESSYAVNTGVLFATSATDYSEFNHALLAAGVWTHVVIRFDGTQATATDRARLWANGVEYAMSSSTGALATTLPSTAHAMRLGRDAADGRVWTGDIDDVRISSALIDPPALYRESLTGNPTTLNRFTRRAVSIAAADGGAADILFRRGLTNRLGSRAVA